MGRNKNKNQRSAARNKAVQSGGIPVTSRKDNGLPAFFKQRQAPGGQSLRRDSSKKDSNGKLAQQNVSQRDLLGGGVAQTHSDGFELTNVARELALSGKRDSSAKAFMKEVRNVIENCDVLLEVLDARDPLGSRSRHTEVLAMSQGKKVVLILNKVDLIPASNLQAWLKYLRNDFPTLAFKSSTQQQRSHLKQGRGEVPSAMVGDKLSHGSEAIGASTLLQLLKNYARTTSKSSSIKHHLSVGVVGPPNVGKSSLINSLLRTRACAVASTPGWTKVVQGVMLEKGIRLLDCPGIVVNGHDGESSSGITKEDAGWSVLRNTVKVELIEDPITPIQAMLKRVESDQLSQLYNIEGGFNENDAHDFLLRVALLRGRLGKGGVPDLEGAARVVLHDWNIGRIVFHSDPPSVHPSLQGKVKENAEEAHITNLTSGTSLMSGFSKAFDLEALFGEADAEALAIGNGGTAGQANGKDLIVPRERKFASESIEEDTELVQAPDTERQDDEHDIGGTSRSTLGKRHRRTNSGLSSGDESDEDIQSLPSTQDDETNVQSDPFVQPPTRKEVVSQRDQELLRAFSQTEVANLARRRGDIRKAAKKNKKRLRKSGAGLVDAWETSMALQSNDTDELSSHINPSGRGVFSLAQDTEKPSPETQSEEEL